MPLTIATWNVNGIRARETALLAWIERVQPDALCLQEIKADTAQIPASILALQDYTLFFNGSVKKGYSGTAMFVRQAVEPAPVFSIPAFDIESRTVQGMFGDLVIIGVYMPRGEKDEHYQVKLSFYHALETHCAALASEGKRVLLCGDMNVAHTELDLHPTHAKPDAVGFRAEERAALDSLIRRGFADVYRKFYPTDAGHYSWWPYWKGARERNLGWRIDCFYASPNLAEKATAAAILTDEKNSDHAPVLLTLEL